MSRYVPEVIVWPADEVAGVEAFIAERCDSMDALRVERPELDELMERNGWSNRALVLGMLVHAAIELATDDEGDEQ